MSTRWATDVMRPGTTRLACWTRYSLPGTMSVSLIQTTMASTSWLRWGRRSGCTSTSPRETSTSSVRVTVTAVPGPASSRSPLKVTRRSTLVTTPEGRTMTSSPGVDDPGGDRAGEAPEGQVGAADELDGEAQVAVLGHGDRDGLEVLHEGRALEPAHVGAGVDHPVALEGRDGDEPGRLLQVEALGELEVVVPDLLEPLLRVVDQVHLVDGHDRVLDAEQRGQVAVALGLGLHAVTGVDQDDGQVTGRGPGDHVAGVLLVARGVGDDELPPGRREVAVGDVDGDALLPLGLEAVHEQGQVELAAGRADGRATRLRPRPAGPRRAGGSRAGGGR